MTLRSKKAALVFFGFVGVCILAFLGLKIINDRHLTRARQIQIGDSMEKVRDLLGSPIVSDSEYFSYASWRYGIRFDFNSGFPWLRVRMTGPGTNDLAFYFDASNRVVRIQMPNQ